MSECAPRVRGAPVPGLRHRRSRRASGRNWRTLPYGAKYDGGWKDTQGEGLCSARAREKRRAARDIAEFDDFLGWEEPESEPHGSDCCLCFDHGPECARCWPETAAIIAERMLGAGLPAVFVHWVVEHAATPGVLDQLNLWMAEHDSAERAAIAAYIQNLIEESEMSACAR